MAMVKFSFADSVRAALASCFPCFTDSRSEPTSNNALPSEPHSASTGPRPASSNDLAHLLRDSDSDALSLHSNLGAASHRRGRHRRRPKFSLTLFGYTLFGRPPIYLSDDEDDAPGRTRALPTTSSSTLDSDAAPLDASTIERLTSPDHLEALVAQRERERQRLEVEEEARRKAERRARRQERKARAKAEALMSLGGVVDEDTFEGFQGSGTGSVPTSLHFNETVVDAGPFKPLPERQRRDGDDGDHNGSHSDDADDADLGGELYTRKKKPSASLSASGSESRSRTSASLSTGDASHVYNLSTHITHQSIPYPHTEMYLPSTREKPRRSSKRTPTVSSVTSQSTSTAPYMPVESVVESPAVAGFPVPQERYLRDGGYGDFPSVGLSGARRSKPLDPRAFLAHQS